jgi:hypothetical protein
MQVEDQGQPRHHELDEPKFGISPVPPSQSIVSFQEFPLALEDLDGQMQFLDLGDHLELGRVEISVAAQQ